MVNCFTEVNDDHVSLYLFVEGGSYFLVESKDLSYTTPLSPELMLAVIENVMFLQVFYRVLGANRETCL